MPRTVLNVVVELTTRPSKAAVIVARDPLITRRSRKVFPNGEDCEGGGFLFFINNDTLAVDRWNHDSRATQNREQRLTFACYRAWL